MKNTSCIVTIIKNEHLYLDEWIKYHLDLGIEHIFIYEDIDSDSHRNITSKYGDKVSLANITTILFDNEKKIALEYKKTKKRNPQFIYFKRCIDYIQMHFYQLYDWCFVIDNDEFITLENKCASIKDVLALYEGYDAFVLQWECYNANGHIETPDYSKKGIINTYTQKTNELAHLKKEYNTKTCYNLHTFMKINMYGVHQPTDYCRWCRTDFSHSRTKPIYKNIYLRHYITKSWEEYINKYTRGYFMGYGRNLETFFRLNNDLLDKKDRLIEELKNETLVVLPYKQGGAQGNELRLMLKGWRKFCQFNYYFVVIGEFDDNLKKEFSWVNFIQYKSKEKQDGQYNPHLDIMNKFDTIRKMYQNRYDGFIYVTDDEYAIKPFTLEDITTIHYHQKSFNGIKELPANFWKHNKWKTRQLLDRENLPHVNYTTHYPCYFEFEKLKDICKKYNMLEESYVFDDVYFNSFEHETPVLDSTIRLGVWSYDIFRKDFKKAVINPNIKFVCNSVDGWSKNLENELKKIVW